MRQFTVDNAELTEGYGIRIVLPVPPLVHRVVASRLDSLPAEAKAALVDAAVLRENVCAAGVVAVRGRAAEGVSGVLEYLERHDLLTRARKPI